MARCHNNLGVLLRPARPEQAEPEYRAALDLYETLAKAHPGVPFYRQGLSRSYSNLGALLIKNPNRLKEAKETLEAALTVQKQLAADFPAAPEYRQDLAKSHNNIAILLNRTKGNKDAVEHHRAAIALQAQLVKDFPIPRYRYSLATSRNNLGFVLQKSAPEQARTLYQAALSSFERLVEDAPTARPIGRALR